MRLLGPRKVNPRMMNALAGFGQGGGVLFIGGKVFYNSVIFQATKKTRGPRGDGSGFIGYILTSLQCCLRARF